MVVPTQCPVSRKRCYMSAEAALEAAGRLVRRKISERLRTYRCADCGNYHLTHLTKQEYNEVVEYKEGYKNGTEFRTFLTEIVGGVKQWQR